MLKNNFYFSASQGGGGAKIASECTYLFVKHLIAKDADNFLLILIHAFLSFTASYPTLQHNMGH